MSEQVLIRILTTSGQHTISVEAGSSEASLIGGHWNAIKVFRDKGEPELLSRYRGVVVGGGHVLETDPRRVKAWAKSGDLDLDDPYAETDGDA